MRSALAPQIPCGRQLIGLLRQVFEIALDIGKMGAGLIGDAKREPGSVFVEHPGMLPQDG